MELSKLFPGVNVTDLDVMFKRMMARYQETGAPRMSSASPKETTTPDYASDPAAIAAMARLGFQPRPPTPAATGIPAPIVELAAQLGFVLSAPATAPTSPAIDPRMLALLAAQARGGVSANAPAAPPPEAMLLGKLHEAGLFGHGVAGMPGVTPAVDAAAMEALLGALGSSAPTQPPPMGVDPTLQAIAVDQASLANLMALLQQPLAPEAPASTMTPHVGAQAQPTAPTTPPAPPAQRDEDDAIARLGRMMGEAIEQQRKEMAELRAELRALRRESARVEVGEHNEPRGGDNDADESVDPEPTEPAASDPLDDRSESVVRAAPTRLQEIDTPGGFATESTTSAPQIHDHRPREPSRARGSPQGKVVGFQARRDQPATGSWQ
ncbi:MAG: hypothetical protein R3A51_16355 [Nannocystaceae bacterium]